MCLEYNQVVIVQSIVRSETEYLYQVGSDLAYLPLNDLVFIEGDPLEYLFWRMDIQMLSRSQINQDCFTDVDHASICIA